MQQYKRTQYFRKAPTAVLLEKCIHEISDDNQDYCLNKFKKQHYSIKCIMVQKEKNESCRRKSTAKNKSHLGPSAAV
jgi:hypothetical protein